MYTPSCALIHALYLKVLFRLGNQYRSPSSERRQGADVEEMLMAAHYQHMYFVSKQYGLKEVTAKCAITLLKYPSMIPQDKAFYQGGMACRDLGNGNPGNANLAFMLLNRYVDLTEAIDTGDASFMDNTDYQDTDAIPLHAALPSTHYLTDEDDREDVRTWVLSVITDSKIEQRVPSREQCRNTLYEAMFLVDRPTCIVTGFPVHPADMLEVNNSVANRRDWNSLVAKTRLCPWTGQNQNPLY